MKKLVVLLCVFWLSACTTLAGLTQKPEVSLAGVDLAELGLFEQHFLLQLRVNNPNDAELAIDGLNFEVDLNGQPFARGSSARAVRIPRYGETVIDVRAVSNLSGLLRQWRELVRSGAHGGREQIDYRIRGQLNVNGLGGVPFEKLGEIPIPRLPDLLPGAGAAGRGL